MDKKQKGTFPYCKIIKREDTEGRIQEKFSLPVSCILFSILFILFHSTGCISSTEIDTFHKNMSVINKGVKQINSEVVKLNSEIERVTVEINRLNSETDKITNEINKFNSGIGRISGELEDINSQFQQKAGIIEETRTEQGNIKNMIADANRVMETGKKNQADLKLEMDNLNEGLQQIASKMDEYIYRMSNLNQRLDSIDVILTQLSGVYKTAAEKGRKDEQSAKEIYQKLNFIGGELVSLQTEITVIKTEINSLGEKLSGVVIRKTDAEAAAVNAGKEENIAAAEQINPQLNQAAELTTESHPIVAIKPEEVYKTAYSDYLKGNFKLAISGFKNYLEKYSDTELAGNSQYWIAECNYSAGDYEKAISEFNDVIKKYPKNTKIPSAMLKIAYAKIKLNQTADAAAQFKTIIKKYPNSDEARLAKEKLKAIK